VEKAAERDNPRSVAVNKNQLATVRRHQIRYPEALRLYDEVLHIFKTAWRTGIRLPPFGTRSGIVHQQAGQHEAAEKAYQESLSSRCKEPIAPAKRARSTNSATFIP